MADATKYYVLKGDKTLAEGLTKEEIYAAIVQAIEQGEIGDVDTGFVTTLKEMNSSTGLKFWIGTEAQYQAITTPERNVLYLITDDTTADDLEEAFEALEEDVDVLKDDMTTLKSDKYYNIGDTGTFTFRGAGYITNATRDLVFTTSLAKKLKAGQKVKITYAQYEAILQNGNYVGGTTASTPVGFDDSAMFASVTEDKLIVLARDNYTFTDAINNTPAGIYVTVNYQIVSAS